MHAEIADRFQQYIVKDRDYEFPEGTLSKLGIAKFYTVREGDPYTDLRKMSRHSRMKPLIPPNQVASTSEEQQPQATVTLTTTNLIGLQPPKLE